MTNQNVNDVLKDIQRFWIKWRDKVPPAESDQWDVIVQEAYEIKQRYGKRSVPVWEGENLITNQEFIVSALVDWFMDELEARERTAYGKEQRNA